MPTIKLTPGFEKNSFERHSWIDGKLVCGIDEVGRGCLAGPVVAAAVILKPYSEHHLLKDSKKLTPADRDLLFAWLQKNSTYSVAIINHRIIDEINIYQATLVAMKRALVQLLATSSEKPQVILVDSMPLKMDFLGMPIYHVNFGEDHSASIAAASVLAKVTRDTLMSRMNQVFPGYQFITNKGYCTKDHVAGLKQKNKTILHRASFLKWFDEI